LLAGLWAWLRELLEQNEPSESEPSSAEKSTGDSKESGNGAASASVSKAELYREAQELGIEGRSKMTKEELAAAVASAREGVPA
jgi:hypothetical protein